MSIYGLPLYFVIPLFDIYVDIWYYKKGGDYETL